MLKTNEKQLVKMAVVGKIAHPMRFEVFEMDYQGKGHALPSVGGIVYNVKVGDSAFGWRGDHIEPGVSCTMDEKNKGSKQSQAFQFLPCIGNEVVVTSGGAKGGKGIVTGHHGGVEHMIVDFDDRTLEKMTGDEHFLVRCFGQGLKIQNCPDVSCFNLDPAVLKKLNLKVAQNGVIEFPVSTIVPAAIMGSGIGHADPCTGDYDITTQDQKMVKKHGIDQICFGDFVAITDADNTYGRHYFSGAVTIGIVIHSDSYISGHGPGVTTLMTSAKGKIKPVIRKNANLGKVLKIGRFRA